MDYDVKFKTDAIELSDKIGVKQAAEELSISVNTLSSWRYKNKNPESMRAAHNKAVAKYHKKSYWHYNLSLNKSTDAELIEMLDASDNKLGLIREALRLYLKKQNKK